MCPHKKGRRGLRDGRPLGDLNEENDTTDNDDDASSSEDDASSNGDLTGEASGGGFEPPLDLKTDARLDSLRRDNAVLQEIVRRQDQVLEEMDQRIREIQAATAQRQAELQALRAARARREAAAAAEEVTTSEQEKKAAEAACAQGGERVEKADGEVAKDGQECRSGGDDDGKEKSDDVVNSKKE